MKYLGVALIVAMGLTAQVSVWAQLETEQGRSQERQRIETERNAASAQFDAADNECKTRFIVASCLDKVKVERNERMDDLKRQESVLNELDRKAAAIKQQQQIEQNTSDATLADKEKNKQEAKAQYAQKAADRLQQAAERGEKTHAPSIKEKKLDEDAAKVARDKAQKRADYEQKQRDLIERRKRRDDNIRENEDKKKEKKLEKKKTADKAAEKAKAAEAADADATITIN